MSLQTARPCMILQELCADAVLTVPGRCRYSATMPVSSSAASLSECLHAAVDKEVR